MVIQLTPRSIIFTLFKRWRAFGLFFVATIAVSVLAAFFLFWKFESVALVVPSFNGQDLADAQLQTQTGGQSSATTNGDLAKLVVASMADTASSYDVERETVQTVGIDKLYPELAAPRFFGSRLDKAIAAFDNDLSVTMGKQSASLTFALQNKDPKVAQAALRALLGYFLQAQAKVEQDPRTHTLQKQLTSASAKVDEAEKRLLDLKRKEGVSDLDTELKLLLNQRDDYEENLSKAMATLAGSKNQEQALHDQYNATPTTIPLTDENDQTRDQLSAARAKLNDAQQGLLLAQQTFTKKSALLKDREEAVALAEQQYNQIAKSSGARVVTGANPVHQTIETQWKQAQTQLAADQAVADTWRARVEAVNARIDHLDGVQGDVDDLTRQLSVANQDYTDYLKRTEEARIKEVLNADSATSLTVVQQPNLPYIPKRLVLVLMLGFGAAVLGGVGLCIGLEVADETLGLPQQVQPTLGVPVLVSLNYAAAPRSGGGEKRDTRVA
ncbi:MAG TPA: hypothetical protein VLV50_00520 [Stellaceae bacterium]|nr:hypothetical protein [Stellaceae bacterium]